MKYFDEATDFRKDTDWISENLTGTNIIQFSIPSGESNGVSDPLFLKNVADFTDWSRSQKEVTNVLSITDVFKRLNRDLNLFTIPLFSFCILLIS